jgi:hypothetical protein
MLTWIKNVIEAQVPGEARTERPGRGRLSIEAVPGEKPLLLLDGFEIIDDRAHVLRREDELRHVRMAGGKAFRQGLGKAFDLVFAREGSEGRGRRVGADAGAADGVAACAIPRQQRFAACCERGGFFCQNRQHRGHCEQGDEIVRDLLAHG